MDIHFETARGIGHFRYFSSVGKIFPSLGFNQRSIKELRELDFDDPLRMSAQAIPRIEEAMVVHNAIQPIIFSDFIIHLDVLCSELPFKSAKVAYADDDLFSSEMLNTHQTGHRGLARVGVEVEDDINEKGKPVKKFTFTIYIYLDSEPCRTPGEDVSGRAQCFRTLFIAMEFINGYRGFIRAVERLCMRGEDALFEEHHILVNYTSDLWERATITSNDIDSLVNGSSPFDHATFSDIIRLMCSYHTIERVLKDAASEAGMTSPTMNHWVKALRDEGNDEESLERKFLNKYKQRWESHHRVDFRLVIKKTWEYFVSSHTRKE